MSMSMNPVRTSAPMDLNGVAISIMDLGGVAIAILKQVAQLPILGAASWPHEHFTCSIPRACVSILRGTQASIRGRSWLRHRSQRVCGRVEPL